MNELSEVITSARNCPNCNSGNVRSYFVDTSFLYGQGESAVEIPVKLEAFKCADCGLEYVDDNAEDRKHEAVCRHLGVFTPAEIESIRHSVGMTRSKFAQLTKIGEATLGRWERGALIQNASHDQFLFLLTFPDNVMRLLNRESLQDTGSASATTCNEGLENKFRSLAKSNRLEAAMKRAVRFRLHDPEAA